MEKVRDAYCKTVTLYTDCQESVSNFDNSELHIRQYKVYKIAQIVVSESLRERTPYSSDRQAIFGHPGQHRVFHTFRQTFHWQPWQKRFFVSSSGCGICKKRKPRDFVSSKPRLHWQYKLKRHLQLFPTEEPLEFVAIDIIGLLPTAFLENEYVLVITNRNFKPTRATPVSKTTA